MRAVRFVVAAIAAVGLFSAPGAASARDIRVALNAKPTEPVIWSNGADDS